MRDYLQSKIYRLSYYLEMFISLILTLVILLLAGKLLVDVFDFGFLTGDADVFSYYLENALNLAVGVELIKMLCKHTPGTVVEVLMFAIARGIVVAHSSAWNTLIGVFCIVLLFATRKYLFIPHDDVTKVTLRGSQSVKMANVLAKVHIPETDGKLLRDVLEKRIAQEDKTRTVGTCVDYDNFALCIASVHDDVITRVDILKAN